MKIELEISHEERIYTDAGQPMVAITFHPLLLLTKEYQELMKDTNDHTINMETKKE